MRIEHTTTSRNKLGYKQSFQAIRIPLHKGNYDAMLEAVYTISPFEKIELKRGQTKAGKIIDYVMTKSDSEKENKILDLLKNKLKSNIYTVEDKSVAKNTKRYYEPTAPLKNESVFGDDYSMTNNKRIILRANIDEELNTRSYWDTTSSKNEYKKVIDFLQKKTYIDDESMAFISDKYKLSGVRRAQKDGFLGEMPVYEEDAKEILTNLKEKANVKSIINLRSNNYKFKNICDELGLKYKYLFVSDTLEEPCFITFDKYCEKNRGLSNKKSIESYKEDAKSDVKDIISTFKVINDGQYYMGCSMWLGSTTKRVIALNEMFNPLCETKGYVQDAEIPVEKAKNFYKHLTDSDKKELGYTTEYEEQLKKRLNIE